MEIRTDLCVVISALVGPGTCDEEEIPLISFFFVLVSGKDQDIKRNACQKVMTCRYSCWRATRFVYRLAQV